MGLPAHIPTRQRGQAHGLETLPRSQGHALSDLHGLHLLTTANVTSHTSRYFKCPRRQNSATGVVAQS